MIDAPSPWGRRLIARSLDPGFFYYILQKSKSELRNCECMVSVVSRRVALFENCETTIESFGPGSDIFERESRLCTDLRYFGIQVVKKVIAFIVKM